MSKWQEKLGDSVFGSKTSAMEPISPLVAGCAVAGFLLILAGKLTGPANLVAFSLAAGILVLKLLARWRHKVSLFHCVKLSSELSIIAKGSEQKKGP